MFSEDGETWDEYNATGTINTMNTTTQVYFNNVACQDLSITNAQARIQINYGMEFFGNNNAKVGDYEYFKLKFAYSAPGSVTYHTIDNNYISSDIARVSQIPAAQVNSDWNASSGVAQILNKPTIPQADIIIDFEEGVTPEPDPDTGNQYIDSEAFGLITGGEAYKVAFMDQDNRYYVYSHISSQGEYVYVSEEAVSSDQLDVYMIYVDENNNGALTSGVETITVPNVSGTNDGTNWTSLTIGSDTYGIGGGSAPSNMVTTDTAQTISGAKTFTSDALFNNAELKFNNNRAIYLGYAPGNLSSYQRATYIQGVQGTTSSEGSIEIIIGSAAGASKPRFKFALPSGSTNAYFANIGNRTADLGSSTYKWNDLYLSGNVYSAGITVSDGTYNGIISPLQSTNSNYSNGIKTKAVEAVFGTTYSRLFNRGVEIGHGGNSGDVHLTVGIDGALQNAQIIRSVGASSNTITIPAITGQMVVAAPPSADGTYVLEATVSSGSVTYNWVLKA